MYVGRISQEKYKNTYENNFVFLLNDRKKNEHARANDCRLGSAVCKKGNQSMAAKKEYPPMYLLSAKNSDIMKKVLVTKYSKVTEYG